MLAAGRPSAASPSPVSASWSVESASSTGLPPAIAAALACGLGNVGALLVEIQR